MRRHLLEIHEQSWCPPFIRDGATDYLRFITTVSRQYSCVIPKLQKALLASQSERIVDLCSGGGGPWPKLQRDLQAALPRPMPVLLTDLHPNKAAARLPTWAEPDVEFAPVPVDATQIPPGLSGFRTLFTAFHHFPPGDARRILQDAVSQGQGIGVFEQTARTPLALLMMLVLPWLAVLAAPFVRPFRLERLFWTWVIPVAPFVLMFDGLVSCLRTYSLAELEQLTAEVQTPAGGLPYHWEIGRVRSPLSPVGICYLIGYPIHEPTDE